MNNHTATREEELAALKVLETAMFEAQDAWEAVNNKDNTPEQAAWRVAFKAFHAARSDWLNSPNNYGARTRKQQPTTTTKETTCK
jgi:hypothetical protein